MQLNKANKAALTILLIAICTALVACSADTPAAAEQSTPPPAESTPAPASQPEESKPAEEAKPVEEAKPEEAAVIVAAPAEASPQITPDQNTVEKPAAAPEQTAPEPTPAPAETPAVPESSFKGVLSSPIAEQPAYLTSIGQSADVQMVKTLLTRAGIKFDFNSTAKADEISGKTLVIAVGGSSKGLGAAGIKAEDELVRASEIIKAAQEKKMTIVSVHVGGEARRGELSDKFIKEVVPHSDYIIVVKEGNKDGLFEKLANGIPIDTVEKITAVVDPLKAAFK